MNTEKNISAFFVMLRVANEYERLYGYAELADSLRESNKRIEAEEDLIVSNIEDLYRNFDSSPSLLFCLGKILTSKSYGVLVDLISELDKDDTEGAYQGLIALENFVDYFRITDEIDIPKDILYEDVLDVLKKMQQGEDERCNEVMGRILKTVEASSE